MAKKFSTGIVNNLSKSRIIADDACLPFLLSARPSALGAGDYMRLADKREQAGGGRAKVDGMPHEGILFSFVLAFSVALVLVRLRSRPSFSSSSSSSCVSFLFSSCLSASGAWLAACCRASCVELAETARICVGIVLPVVFRLYRVVMLYI